MATPYRKPVALAGAPDLDVCPKEAPKVRPAQRPEGSKGGVGWPLVVARERRHELTRLALRRRGDLFRPGYALGPSQGWAAVLVNLAIVLYGNGSPRTVRDLAAVVGYREPIDDRLIVSLSRDSEIASKVWGRRYQLLEPDAVATLLEVSSAEREELNLRRIGAVEETSSDRRKRQQREWVTKRRRSGGMAPKAPAAKPWIAAGVSRATWFRRRGETEVSTAHSIGVMSTQESHVPLQVFDEEG